ncbi:MAG TPA: hypothetical protein VM582_06895 [Candidatus Thermoplasmatota archaeon]|nr:hypothetical protein [Candidatus Thermoplasmatota archaeon]
MASSALITAGVAAALLVVVVGIDASMTKTHAIDVWTGTGWRELARTPMSFERAPHSWGAPPTISANASDDLRFRVRVDNSYAWSTTDDFRALLAGEEVASGRIETPARSTREAEFTVSASRYFERGARGPEMVEAGAPPLVYADLMVVVDGKQLFPSFQIREVSA